MSFLKIALTYIFIVFSFLSFAGQQPVIKCISVVQNGDVIVNWEPITDDCSGFTSYEIYFSNTISGPYTIGQTITNELLSQCTVGGTTSSNQANYFFIKTSSNCGTFYSDTINSIYLDVINPGNSTSRAEWTVMHNPLTSGSAAYYHIYREYPAGNWSLWDSVSVASNYYSEEIYTCSKTINYQISLENNFGCTSFSNIDGDVFTDIKPPYSPIMDSVSVVILSGNIVVGWERSTSPDVYGYIIYKVVNGSNYPIDTIYGADNTLYQYSGSNASKFSESYCVAAFDSCELPGPISAYHQTIYAFPYYDECLAQIRLEWNHYVGWNEGIKNYKIFFSKEGAPFSYLATVAGNLNYYYHDGLSGNTTYCYYVVAENNNGNKSSTSNITCLTTQISSFPDMLNANYATVDGYNELKLSFNVDTDAEIKSLKIMRSDSLQGHYYQIDLIQDPRSNPVECTDYIDIFRDVFFYKAIALNKCDTAIRESNIANNIVLRVFNSGNLEHTLVWNDYYNWEGSVESYNIYRQMDGNSPVLISKAYPGINSYVDDISTLNLVGNAGNCCYYIEAVEGDSNPYGIKGHSISNISCAEEFPRVFIPNAFTPNSDGVNDVFYANVTFANPEDYEFIIFNRWGEQVFHTNDPLEGWTGIIDGHRVPAGAYAYRIYFTTAENEVFEDSGIIMVIYP